MIKQVVKQAVRPHHDDITLLYIESVLVGVLRIVLAQILSTLAEDLAKLHTLANLAATSQVFNVSFAWQHWKLVGNIEVVDLFFGVAFKICGVLRLSVNLEARVAKIANIETSAILNCNHSCCRSNGRNSVVPALQDKERV